jgi:tetratricopeptide (TPR) repeat protein
VPELELGTRYADVGQWERALETWKSALDRAPEKEAGYLAHNIAIAYEVMGDFDSAIYWAKLAYTRYGNEESRSYVNQIKQRLSSEGLAQMQQQ